MKHTVNMVSHTFEWETVIYSKKLIRTLQTASNAPELLVKPVKVGITMLSWDAVNAIVTSEEHFLQLCRS